MFSARRRGRFNDPLHAALSVFPTDIRDRDNLKAGKVTELLL